MIKVSRQTMQSFRRAGRKIAKAAREVSGILPGGGLRMIGEEIMADVKDSRPGHGVPVDSGALRSTGRVEGGGGPALLARVTLDFGGPAAPYALIQHENLSYRHTVGEPRYLVRGLERWSPTGSNAMHQMRRMAKGRLAKLGRMP